MIPTIETIVEDLLANLISKQQAIAWLHQHAADACRALRDDFAMTAPPAVFDVDGWTVSECGKELGVDYNYRQHYRQLMAKLAYEYADAMLAARAKDSTP